jgi:hypothetical protein
LGESAYDTVGQYDNTDRDEEIVDKLKRKTQEPSEPSSSEPVINSTCEKNEAETSALPNGF